MSWRQSLAQFLVDLLRVAIRVCLFIDGIMVAIFSIWFCGKFLYFTLNWLNSSMFSSPW